MTLIFKNLVRDTTETTGTGPLTLTGDAPEGFQSFAAAGFGDGEHTGYVIRHGAYWEACVGAVGDGGGTLTRETLLGSSNNGDPVSFAAGVKEVICGLPAELGNVWIGEDPPEIAIESRLWIKPSSAELSVYADFGEGEDWQVIGGGGGGSPSGVLSVRVEVSSEQILNLADTPVDLIAAPGAGKMISVISATAMFTLGVNPYVVTDSEYPYYQLGEAQVFQSPIFIDNPYSFIATPIPADVSVDLIYVENQPLILMAGVNPTDGDGTLTIDLLYRIVDLP